MTDVQTLLNPMFVYKYLFNFISPPFYHKNVRNKMNMTQVTFAAVMGVSTKAVEAWESGRNVPSGSARRMLGMLKTDPNLPEKYNIIE